MFFSTTASILQAIMDGIQPSTYNIKTATQDSLCLIDNFQCGEENMLCYDDDMWSKNIFQQCLDTL